MRVLAGGCGDIVKASKGACSRGGMPRWDSRSSGKGLEPHASSIEVCASVSVASLRNFISDLVERRSMLLSAKTSSRPPGILFRFPVGGMASNVPTPSFFASSLEFAG